ncbi:hypothetical protein M2650_16370 [Luteimonas sp. SX5]|uniref:Uncharacterized protein n=1 Tax=Luteimonas galliterrae TaxID=2940486 RepID=A0ABT0MMT7_9GAMM|nr:hypothetical protein [Luteimonas galliterrae]MCL1636197.1 hypothetical protein [Luteimonas galliterrae]
MHSTYSSLPSAVGRDIWSQLAGSIKPTGANWIFLGTNAAAVMKPSKR